ncbi:hypothetical protein GDO81_024681 [Engystomops pustulosus]|uniref:Taste receptor type 2 n=1 Tax=Engystomops pustulosus TaxID=76066 RepID=A0AAV6ZPW5_ENGPU|nr:hypothetical protein GDO81_024681 [Engystomops pustulosus]
MADPSDTNVLYLGLLVPALMALIAGLVIHSFIIGVNVSDWWRGRSLTPVDHVVFAIEISRICSQSTATLYYLLDFLSRRNLSFPLTQRIVGINYSLFNYGNFWLTSLLSIVFYLKVSNIHTRLFVYLRRMMLPRTGCLIVASLLLSAINCVLPMLKTITEVINRKYNKTTDNLFNNYPNVDAVYNFSIGTFFPLVFYCISSVLLFVSLYHHTTRMKMSSNLSINLETYYSAMRFVTVTFIYNTTYFIVLFFCVFYYYLYRLNLKWILIFLEVLPALHSSFLIYRTAKLRSQMSKVLQNVMDFLFQNTKNPKRT